MPTIQIEANLSKEQTFNAPRQMSRQELSQLVEQALALRARHSAWRFMTRPHIPAKLCRLVIARQTTRATSSALIQAGIILRLAKSPPEVFPTQSPTNPFLRSLNWS